MGYIIFTHVSTYTNRVLAVVELCVSVRFSVCPSRSATVQKDARLKTTESSVTWNAAKFSFLGQKFCVAQ